VPYTSKSGDVLTYSTFWVAEPPSGMCINAQGKEVNCSADPAIRVK